MAPNETRCTVTLEKAINASKRRPLDCWLHHSTNPSTQDTEYLLPITRTQHQTSLHNIVMVQYDPFDPMFTGKNALPLRGHDLSEVTRTPQTQTHQTNDDSHSQNTTLHPQFAQLRRLSSSQGIQQHYCHRCHMRRPSQEQRFLSQNNEHSPSEETWDGFCPDIAMPDHSTPRSPSLHHTRRHSGLCPTSMITQEQNVEGRGSPVQMTMKPRLSRSGSHSSGGAPACHCETILPVENLSERYGLVEEPATIEVKDHHPRRESLEKEAASQLAEIMHEELVADMEAQQCRL